MLIFNALTLQVVNIVQAHKTSVSNISINSEGTMLATASDKVHRRACSCICIVYCHSCGCKTRINLWFAVFIGHYRELSFGSGRYLMLRGCTSSDADHIRRGYIRSPSTLSAPSSASRVTPIQCTFSSWEEERAPTAANGMEDSWTDLWTLKSQEWGMFGSDSLYLPQGHEE